MLDEIFGARDALVDCVQGGSNSQESFRASCCELAGRRSDLDFRVGLAGFEPATSCSQSKRAAKLRHSPCTAPSLAVPAGRTLRRAPRCSVPGGTTVARTACSHDVRAAPTYRPPECKNSFYYEGNSCW
jgi:hypothetical protein